MVPRELSEILKAGYLLPQPCRDAAEGTENRNAAAATSSWVQDYNTYIRQFRSTHRDRLGYKPA